MNKYTLTVDGMHLLRRMISKRTNGKHGTIREQFQFCVLASARGLHNTTVSTKTSDTPFLLRAIDFPGIVSTPQRIALPEDLEDIRDVIMEMEVGGYILRPGATAGALENLSAYNREQYSIKEIAAKMNISDDTVRRQIERKELRVIKRGAKYSFHAEDDPFKD